MYRVRLRAFVAGLAILSIPKFFPDAGIDAATAQLALQAPVLAEDTVFAAVIAGKIDQRLSRAASPSDSQRDKAWDRQLRSFYIARGGRPVWVSRDGFTARARSALEELGRAESFGLDATPFTTPRLDTAVSRDDALADAELQLSRMVVNYAFQARGGRIVPSSLSLWLDRTPDDVYASQVMIDIISGEDTGAVLRAMHPQSAAFNLLRQAYVQLREEMAHPRALDAADVIPAGPAVKVGEWNPAIIVLRRRLKVAALAGYESLFDEKLANALDDRLDEARIKRRWGRLDDRARDYFNQPPKPPTEDDVNRVLANMERWRWLPRDLGSLHIWNNLPEFMTRVVKDGTVIHEERIIVGQPDTQTPVFSDKMRQVVFQPEWGVPPSIKINDLLPKLQAGDYDVLERRDMRILGISGKELNPERFNWDKVDIRDIGIYQRSGDGNPLGRVKFLFPNKFHVYMHDTNNPALFKQTARTFSHGCIRVRDPKKFAEVVLGADQGWDADEVEAHLKNWKKPNNKIDLEHPLPVHNVYFTLVPDGKGALIQLADVYGHDKRVIQALLGVDPKRIAANDPARQQQAELEEAAPPQVRKANAAARAAEGDVE